MKKKLIIIVTIIIISMSTALTLTMTILTFLSSTINTNFPTGKNTGKYQDDFIQESLKSSTPYDIKADIGLANNIVHIREDIAIRHPGKTVYLYLPSANAADTDILKVISDNGEATAVRHDTMLEVNCSTISGKVTIEYEIRLNEDSNILSYSGSSTFLGNFLATPAVYKGGKPIMSYKSAFGDPYVYEALNYYVLFRVDSSLSVYAPGEKAERTFGSNKIAIFQASTIRDFSAVIVKSADVRKIKHGKINLVFINSCETRKDVEYAFDYAEKMIGPYPYEDFYIVKMPLYHEGMEFSNMIFLSDSAFKNPAVLKRLTYHEVFHQWFYGIIGTDQLNEPFLDEGLVSYLSGSLSNSTFKGNGTENFRTLMLKDYTSRQDYYSLAYDASALYFDRLQKKMGTGFYKALQRAYSQYKFKIMHFNDFENIVSEISGSTK